jgi:hypothetical protein
MLPATRAASEFDFENASHRFTRSPPLLVVSFPTYTRTYESHQTSPPQALSLANLTNNVHPTNFKLTSLANQKYFRKLL